MAGASAGEPDDADRRKLMQRLAELGAAPEEIKDADETGTLGPLALELALRGRDVISFDEAAAAAELEREEAAWLWRALGFPDPLESPPRMTPGQAATLRTLAGMRNLLGDRAAGELAPVIGGSIARLAEAIVDAFRIHARRSAAEPLRAGQGD